MTFISYALAAAAAFAGAVAHINLSEHLRASA
jgi:hypothetical protein